MRTIRRCWPWALGVLCCAALAAGQEVPRPGSHFPEPQPAPASRAVPEDLPAAPAQIRPLSNVGTGSLSPAAIPAEPQWQAPGVEELPASQARARPWRPGSYWRTCVKPRLQESHWGYADEFEETPLGTSVDAHMSKQVANGMVSRMVLYRYDFVQDPGEKATHLNERGRRRLSELTGMFACNVHPLVIESTPDAAELDSARRAHVLDLLQAWGFPVPDEWVVCGVPNAAGVSGAEAVEMHKNQIRQTQSGGAPLGSASEGGSSTGIMQGVGRAQGAGY